MANSKPKRTPRKGRAVAYEPIISDITKNNRRGFFLDAVKKLEPRVLEDLSQEPLMFFRSANLTPSETGVRTFYNAWEVLKSERWSQLMRNAPLLWFRRKLWDWGERWKLSEEWCLKAAYETLGEWAYKPELPSDLSWSLMIYSGGYVISPIPNEDKFSFEHRGWELTSYRTRKKYEQFIRAEFEKALKAYCDRIEEAAPVYGYVKIPPPKHPRKPHLPAEWLVRYRVQGWNVSQINAYYYKSDNRNTIRKGINEAAAALGFPLYDFKGG